MKFRKIFVFYLSFVIAFWAPNIAFSQNDSAALAAADTSRFSPNGDEGWQLYNSYVAPVSGDSATLELILQHANNIDTTMEQFVGVIKDVLLIPSQEQVISFNLLINNYLLRIDTVGRCYIRFLNGDVPPDDPFVIPLKIFYKL